MAAATSAEDARGRATRDPARATGSSLAGGRASRSRCASSSCSSRSRRVPGGSSGARSSTRSSGGADLRDGDRSIDVYVHKLRVKLEQALPEWRFIHTHVGFGYRLQPERSHDFHEAVTGP